MSTQEIGELVNSVNDLTQTVAGKTKEIDNRMEEAESEFDQWKANFSETINGIEVYKQGGIRRFFFNQLLNTGGYTSDGGPDNSFPVCANPQPPTYVNLLEYVTTSSYGAYGDMFKIEFVMTHRGMGSTDGYTDHFIFTGTSFNDSVAGQVEVKKVSRDGAISIFTSMPNSVEDEIALTKSLEGTTIPVSFRSIGQGVSGKARVTLKVDTRHHCGNDRSFGADVTYTSSRGRPAENRVSQIKPKWDV